MLIGVALIHAEEIAGENRRFVAAGAGADFENDVAVVHGVLGQKRGADLLPQRQAFGFQRRPFGIGDGAHLGLGRTVLDQAVEIGEFGRDSTIGLHTIRHRAELGKFAREPHVGFRRQRLGELRFDRGMARKQRIELGFRQHGSGPTSWLGRRPKGRGQGARRRPRSCGPLSGHGCPWMPCCARVPMGHPWRPSGTSF